MTTPPTPDEMRQVAETIAFRWHNELFAQECEQLADDIFQAISTAMARYREALVAAVHTLDVHGHIDGGTDLHERLRAAIAKATGDHP
jgi:hypothetical protein